MSSCRELSVGGSSPRYALHICNASTERDRYPETLGSEHPGTWQRHAISIARLRKASSLFNCFLPVTFGHMEKQCWKKH